MHTYVCRFVPTLFDTLTTGNVAALLAVHPRARPYSLLPSALARLIRNENFSSTNERISSEFQAAARHYRRWLRERNQFSSLVRFLFCTTRYMTLYGELPIATRIRWNSTDREIVRLLSLFPVWKSLSMYPWTHLIRIWDREWKVRMFEQRLKYFSQYFGKSSRDIGVSNRTCYHLVYFVKYISCLRLWIFLLANDILSLILIFSYRSFLFFIFEFQKAVQILIC